MSGPTCDIKGEMLFGVGDLIGSDGKREAKLSLRIRREDTSLWDLKPLLVRIVYFEVEVIEGKCLKDKDKFLGYFAFWFDVVVILTRVLEG